MRAQPKPPLSASSPGAGLPGDSSSSPPSRPALFPTAVALSGSADPLGEGPIAIASPAGCKGGEGRAGLPRCLCFSPAVQMMPDSQRSFTELSLNESGTLSWGPAECPRPAGAAVRSRPGAGGQSPPARCYLLADPPVPSTPSRLPALPLAPARTRPRPAEARP